jgi:hypothetical protein
MAKFDRKIPYNDLPLLPPTADIETKRILRKAAHYTTLTAAKLLLSSNAARAANSPKLPMIIQLPK